MHDERVRDRLVDLERGMERVAENGRGVQGGMLIRS